MSEKAIFAAGCFWGVEADFRQIPGVTATRVGYTGGHTTNPTHEQGCSHTTGHAEAGAGTFDPEQGSYDGLLDVFWHGHDPTPLNRPGWGVRGQHPAAIFFP